MSQMDRYEWMETPYVGAAHGLLGIFFAILQFTERVRPGGDIHAEVVAGLDWILDLEENGGWPSVVGELECLVHWWILDLEGNGGWPSVVGELECLVHWCHGSAGAALVFIKAYSVLGDRKYLLAAERAAQAVWEKGLLKRGPGLCHGTSGSGYALLALFRVTCDAKWYARACHLADWLMNSDEAASVS